MAAAGYQQQLAQSVAENGEIIRWIITLGVSIGALLEVIDSSIVNVALPHIQGNLGATTSEAAWVITAYAIANAVILPLAAWLGDRFGRKSYFIFSLIGFTLSSIMCGMAANLVFLVISRVIQGLFGGGLLAKAQAILFETFPREKQGMVQGVFGVCVIVGPILGPTLGGYLTDNLDWRWIFFINIPFGIVAVLLCAASMPTDIKEAIKSRVDWWGIIFLTAWLSSLQYVLEKGQDEDWFSSRTILTLSVTAVVSFVLFLAQELSVDKPVVDLRVLRHPPVASGVFFSLILGMSLYGIGYVIPNFAQVMLGYTAFQAGVLQVPGSILSGFLMPLVGAFAPKFDARILVACGTTLLAFIMFDLSHLTLNTGWNQFFFPLLFRGMAVVLMYMPLTLATIGGAPLQDIPAATAFVNLARMLGGSIGIAMLNTELIRRVDFHRVILIEKVTPFSQDAMSKIHALSGVFEQAGQSGKDATYKATALMNALVVQQATVLSFEDLAWTLGALLIASLPLCLFLSSGKRVSGGNVEVH
ncbi:MAG: DHA2 family efflux MFS transporter permease subunit [Candidatus Obscuribacterales bacterium]|nr:DHA2 family efflux MFS transporter permease subunit [Candidatus Obscuribacterales bacterium]